MLGTTNATPPVRNEAKTPEWAVAQAQEFVPRHLDPPLASHVTSSAMAASDLSQQTANAHEVSPPNNYEAFAAATQHNPYLDNSINGTAYFQSTNAFQQPVSLPNRASLYVLIFSGTISSVCTNWPLQHQHVAISENRS